MSREIDDGGPAFPGQVGAYGRGNDVPVATGEGTTEYVQVSHGITARDYFAAKALSYAMHDTRLLYDAEKIRANECLRLSAKLAYRIADAMLAARKSGDA